MNKKTNPVKSTSETAPESSQFDKHREQLVSLRDQLASQIRSLSTAAVANQQPGEELADIGSDNFIRETELTLMDEEGQRISLINAALERLEEGTYGICVDCGEPIPEPRLDAKPYAAYCVDCKEAHEAHDGYPSARRAG